MLGYLASPVNCNRHEAVTPPGKRFFGKVSSNAPALLWTLERQPPRQPKEKVQSSAGALLDTFPKNLFPGGVTAS